jgi:hypothetical protein
MQHTDSLHDTKFPLAGSPPEIAVVQDIRTTARFTSAKVARRDGAATVAIADRAAAMRIV